MNTYSFGAQGRVDRTISSYHYIGRGKTSEKVGCSIGSEAAFN